MNDLMHIVDWFDTFEEIISNNGKISPQYKFKERLPRDSISLWKAINKGFPIPFFEPSFANFEIAIKGVGDVLRGPTFKIKFFGVFRY